MRKNAVQWQLSELKRHFARINFPEYQREPNVWERAAKQRLIDSIARQFDISSIYIYQDEDKSMDCIDGRQRISAIMSFLGENQEDKDNGFEFRLMNEIYEDTNHPFASLHGQTFAQLRASSDETAKRFISAFTSYELTIVQLSGSREPEEFNLQFTRLNLGTIINSGEKLHAMVGELRDACFGEAGLGQHQFLEMTKIPTRRFAKEQTAAQIIAQVFSFAKAKEFTRTRHFDLQRLFKEHATLTSVEKALLEETKALLDLLHGAFRDVGILKNRSITVSTVLLAWQVGVKTGAAALELAKFIAEFNCRLQWQIAKELDVDDEYRYLVDFQKHLTQASVEKPAVTARASLLAKEFAQWQQTGLLTGDAAYKKRTGRDPVEVCRETNSQSSLAY